MNKNGFKIPDNYFDHFPNKVMSRIKAEKKKKKTFQLSVISSIAASVLIVFLSVYTMYKQEDKNEDCQLSEIEYFGIEMNDVYDICENTNSPIPDLEDTEIIDFLDNDELNYEWLIDE